MRSRPAIGVPGLPDPPGEPAPRMQPPAHGPSQRGDARRVLVRGDERRPCPLGRPAARQRRPPGRRPVDPWPRRPTRRPGRSRSARRHGVLVEQQVQHQGPGRVLGREGRDVVVGPTGEDRRDDLGRPAARRRGSVNDVSRSSRHQPPVPRPMWKACSPWPHAGSRGNPRSRAIERNADASSGCTSRSTSSSLGRSVAPRITAQRTPPAASRSARAASGGSTAPSSDDPPQERQPRQLGEGVRDLQVRAAGDEHREGCEARRGPGRR